MSRFLARGWDFGTEGGGVFQTDLKVHLGVGVMPAPPSLARMGTMAGVLSQRGGL